MHTLSPQAISLRRAVILRQEARGYGMDLSKFWHHTKLLTAFAAYIEESHGPDVTIDEYLHYHMIDTLKKDKSQQR